MPDRATVDLRSLRRFGAHELRRTIIASFERHADGVCVVVGTDHGGVAVLRLVSGIVYLPHSHGSLTQEDGVGIIQACRHTLR